MEKKVTPLYAEGAAEAREVAEEARAENWEHPSLAAEMFMGNFHAPWIYPFPEQSAEDRAVGDAWIQKLEKFLQANLDPDAVDRTHEIPQKVLQGLKDMGAFALKIPQEYGGLGFSQINYNRAIMKVASFCGNTAVWLSAHQSIGVPQPLKLFGTEEQKQKYLPRFSEGAISAFALTEPSVGSDPAQMKTTATPIENGQYYLLNGEKLWCTNGPVADLIVVMAQTPPKNMEGKLRKQITAFIVETNTPGFEVVHRCDFMGLKGIQNGLLRFKDVKVPRENILLGEGRGLKLALETLNTGRLTLPAAGVGLAKQCLHILRDWANERVQWGAPIGKHEAVASELAWINAHTLAMEAVTFYTSALVDRGDSDVRIEAAMAKLFCSEVGWKIIDKTLQVRGGRGYETADSLKARGEKPYPVERMMRDARINTIIEGSTDIMHLFIAREALDRHLSLGQDLFNPKTTWSRKMRSLARAFGFYAHWYPQQWLSFSTQRYTELGQLAPHARYIERTTHKLARKIFHAMARYRLGLEKQQVLLSHFVEIGTSLFAMAATISFAQAQAKKNAQRENAIPLTELFCRYQRQEIAQHFRALFNPTDPVAYRTAQDYLSDQYAWLEEGILPVREYFTHATQAQQKISPLRSVRR